MNFGRTCDTILKEYFDTLVSLTWMYINILRARLSSTSALFGLPCCQQTIRCDRVPNRFHTNFCTMEITRKKKPVWRLSFSQGRKVNESHSTHCGWWTGFYDFVSLLCWIVASFVAVLHGKRRLLLLHFFVLLDGRDYLTIFSLEMVALYQSSDDLLIFFLFEFLSNNVFGLIKYI